MSDLSGRLAMLAYWLLPLLPIPILGAPGLTVSVLLIPLFVLARRRRETRLPRTGA
jgi:hypothetical protein